MKLLLLALHVLSLAACKLPTEPLLIDWGCRPQEWDICCSSDMTSACVPRT